MGTHFNREWGDMKRHSEIGDQGVLLQKKKKIEGKWRKMWIQGGCLRLNMGALMACLYATESLVEVSNGSDPVGRE